MNYQDNPNYLGGNFWDTVQQVGESAQQVGEAWKHDPTAVNQPVMSESGSATPVSTHKFSRLELYESVYESPAKKVQLPQDVLRQVNLGDFADVSNPLTKASVYSCIKWGVFCPVIYEDTSHKTAVGIRAPRSLQITVGALALGLAFGIYKVAT